MTTELATLRRTQLSDAIELYRDPMIKKIIQYSLLTLMVALFIVAGYSYWLHQLNFPSTDDAYIEAHTINIAPQVNGVVQAVLAHNQEHVIKDQVLFTIDPKPFQLAYQRTQANLANTGQEIKANQNAVRAAQAELAERQAQLIDTQKNYDRISSLVKQNYYARSGGDDATRELTVAKQAAIAANDHLSEMKATLGAPGNANAQIQLAKNAVAQAKLNLEYTKITAPANGQLAKFALQPGQTVTAYDAVFSLVEDKKWWAVANMKETNLSRVHVGQKAKINIDMYPTHPFQGVVESISPGSGSSFDLLPAENASGNWVKVTQRFPVHVKILHTDPTFPLRTGASCTVIIDTTH